MPKCICISKKDYPWHPTFMTDKGGSYVVGLALLLVLMSVSILPTLCICRLYWVS